MRVCSFRQLWHVSLRFFALVLGFGISVLVSGCGGSSGGSGGGGTTQTPTPAISSITPATAMAGSADLKLTVSGSGFVNTSVVQVGTTSEATSYVSATQLTATVPAAQLASGADLPVTVLNGSLSSGTGTPIKLEVDNPAPTVTSISPTSESTGAASPVVTVCTRNRDRCERSIADNYLHKLDSGQRISHCGRRIVSRNSCYHRRKRSARRRHLDGSQSQHRCTRCASGDTNDHLCESEFNPRRIGRYHHHHRWNRLHLKLGDSVEWNGSGHHAGELLQRKRARRDRACSRSDNRRDSNRDSGHTGRKPRAFKRPDGEHHESTSSHPDRA